MAGRRIYDVDVVAVCLVRRSVSQSGKKVMGGKYMDDGQYGEDPSGFPVSLPCALCPAFPLEMTLATALTARLYCCLRAE